MKKQDKALWITAGLLGLGALYFYNRKKSDTAMTFAEKADDKTNTMVECGMELSYPNGLKDVDAKIEEYAGSADCIRLLGEYVEKYHPEEYSKLVMAGEMNNDQAQAALEIDKQTVAMALNALQMDAVSGYRPSKSPSRRMYLEHQNRMRARAIREARKAIARSRKARWR